MLVLVDLDLWWDRDDLELLAETFLLNFVVLKVEAVSNLTQFLFQGLVWASVFIQEVAESRLHCVIDLNVGRAERPETLIVHESHERNPKY